ncbi:MAG TPA: thiolase family protein [Stellaceae bacterium]|nr:thiolase family protein [Stellaceae bacterium]
MSGASWIAGVGDTPYGRLDGETPLSLMATAGAAALAQAGLPREAVDGLLCGYSGTLPHLMLATLFAEYFGLRPRYAHALQAGGATGGLMVMLAHRLVAIGQCRHVLVVAGDNRLTGQGRDNAVAMLAQVGHHDYEVPFGPTIPAYYALFASRYTHLHGVSERDLAEFAVLMRRHAALHPGAHLRKPITIEDVLSSRPIATPLKLLDCCPVSDGAAAVLVRSEAPDVRVRIAGAAQVHPHQHVSAAADLADFDLADCAERALGEARATHDEVDVLAIYDSFTITLLALLEETGFAPRGRAAAMARDGVFARDGRWPLNTHGGLLSFGHSGVAGGLAHIVEACRQLRGEAGVRQLREPDLAFIHGDGGVMSSHVSLVLRRE